MCISASCFGVTPSVSAAARSLTAASRSDVAFWRRSVDPVAAAQASRSAPASTRSDGDSTLLGGLDPVAELPDPAIEPIEHRALRSTGLYAVRQPLITAHDADRLVQLVGGEWRRDIAGRQPNDLGAGPPGALGVDQGQVALERMQLRHCYVHVAAMVTYAFACTDSRFLEHGKTLIPSATRLDARRAGESSHRSGDANGGGLLNFHYRCAA